MRRHLVIAAAVAVLLGTVACGGDDADAERAELTLSLGFLSTDFGLTEAQVRCVSGEIEDGAGQAELAELAAAVRAVDAGDTTLDELPDEQGDVVRSAIATCAASG